MLKVYAIEAPYEGPQALFATREAAEAALANTDEWPARHGYFIVGWRVHS